MGRATARLESERETSQGSERPGCGMGGGVFYCVFYAFYCARLFFFSPCSSFSKAPTGFLRRRGGCLSVWLAFVVVERDETLNADDI